MSKEYNDNNLFSAADLARYHNGEMSEKERHALEKAALDDPFLADALEGFEGHTTEQAREDMGELHKRLARRIEGKKRRLAFPIYRVGIAAAVFLLAGSLSVIYFLNKADDQARDVIVQEVPVTRADTGRITNEASADEVIKTDPTVIKSADSTGYDPERSSQDIGGLKPFLPPASLARVREEIGKDSKQEDDPARKQEAVADATSVQKTAPSPALSSPPSAEIFRQNEANKSSREMTARNEPLKKKMDTTLQEVVVVGYGVQKKQTSTGSVALLKPTEPSPAPAVALEGKVSGVQAAKNASSKPAASKILKSAAKPTILPYGIRAEDAGFYPLRGWNRYSDRFSKSISGKSAFAAKQGEMIIVFKIDKRSSPIEIRVEKSDDALLDGEVIQLLKSGSKWKVRSGVDSTVRVIVTY